MPSMIRALTLLAALSYASVSAQTTGSGGQSPLHTAVSLIADVAHVRPGEAFTAGLLMRMEPGWHTYWKNPGEAGLPTTIAWTLPAGFSAGEIRWPLPDKHLESGDVLTYGYGKEVLLLVPITVDAGVRPGAAKLRAEVSWLECERICLPGSGTVDLTLRVDAAPAVPANGGLFARYTARLPRERTDEIVVGTRLERGAAVVTVRPPAGGTLAVEPGVVPDFYPGPLEGLAVGRTEIDAGGGEATLRIPLSVYEPLAEARTLSGVVVYRAPAGDLSGVELALPLPASFVASLAGPEGEAGTSVLDRSFRTTEAAEEERSLAVYLLFALLGGLLLNIMPCVLPAISLKIFGLVRMSGDAPQRVKRHGLMFAAGILASFLALAGVVILLQSAGEQVGWGFQFQEPLFVIAMATVVFVFGLSLFGVFEVGMLFVIAFAGVGSALERRARDSEGYGASFWEGVFATVLATPCTAPFLGTALGFAFSQPAHFTLLVFAAVGFGMALPYIVLTAQPAWMKFLPKPGPWMETVKQFMGFLLMATMLWLLYVLGKQLGMEAVIWTSAFLLVVGVGCWLIGRFATLSSSRRKFLLTWVAAFALAATAYVVFVDATLRAGTVLARPSDTSSRSGGIAWEPFSVARLDAVLAEGKTVFLDFTAEWCLTCKVNEKTVLADDAVVEAILRNNVVPIKADWTNRNPEITQLLAKFGRSGVPLYVVFPAGAPDAPIVLPEVITTGIVLDALRRAAGAGG